MPESAATQHSALSTQHSALSTRHSALRIDWLLILALVALVLPLRAWLIYNTEVTARDSIGYIRFALQFEQKPWTEVLKGNQQHPGYPVMVFLMSQPVRAFAGETTPENMGFSTQLVSFIASLILLMPMYWLGRQYFDRPVSFWGALLYQYLPISAHHLSDGVSEPTYLVFLISGLLFMTRALRHYRVGDCCLCGVFTGLAYLTRPEGLLILPAFGLTLLAIQFFPAWRGTRVQFLRSGLAMVMATCLVGCVYVYATGKITNKPSAIEVISNTTGQQAGVAGDGLHLFAETFSRSEHRAVNLLRGARALAMEIMQGYHYVAAIPAFFGFWWSFTTLRRYPDFWALAVFILGHASILIALAMSVNYISDRHVMILVICGSYCVVVGLREAPRRILAWCNPSQAWFCSTRIWFAILLAILFASCLPKSLERLHANRAGNHAAGLWLRTQLADGDLVEDDHAYSHFYSGLILTEGLNPAYPRELHATRYVVTTRSKDPEIDQKRQNDVLADRARVVYVWPENAEVDRARVVIYSQPRDYDRYPWRIAH